MVRAAPDDLQTNQVRAFVLAGLRKAWGVGPRSAAELREAAMYVDRAAALSPAPAIKAELAGMAASCRRQAEAM